MDIQKISSLINIINREKNTSNILFTMDKRGIDMKNISIEHSYILLNLAKLLSQYDINIEIDEPHFERKNKEEAIITLIDDISIYTEILRGEDDNTKELVTKLINIKCNLIKEIIKDERAELILTKDELLKFDGSNGNPAYVAIDGIIYDVTKNKTWLDGVHFGLVAGRDLTEEINSCHDNKEAILSKLTPVGKLK
ncbi:cytochrome b5 domain-containing protein [Caloramator proteoclasticus]|uniref:Predicted heme/steroid binding protein n=1 Tax=Caloramator proteoclasticus DSM 10124 TaxID=1121262 RepID=A0A1M5BTK6_9CLOT|nr:cytochrome b5 domain-containing protein [Caloramator proteoclasticus]SHF45883.1 Predicted heme/steroid binding protein [Caloramator proteoclasticus DSM 10124]